MIPTIVANSKEAVEIMASEVSYPPINLVGLSLALPDPLGIRDVWRADSRRTLAKVRKAGYGGCVGMEKTKVVQSANEYIQTILGRSESLAALARKSGIPVGTLSDIRRGKACMRRVRRRLMFETVQDTPTAILAWQIKNRVEVR